MAGYWIVRGAEIGDADALQEYGKLWPEIATRFGAEVIAGNGRSETREGPEYARQLIVRFESHEQALACYDSPEYQASPKGSWKQAMSPRMRIIHSNAVEVERGVAHST